MRAIRKIFMRGKSESLTDVLRSSENLLIGKLTSFVIDVNVSLIQMRR